MLYLFVHDSESRATIFSLVYDSESRATIAFLVHDSESRATITSTSIAHNAAICDAE